MGSDNGDKPTAAPETGDAKAELAPVVVFTSVPLLIGYGVATLVFKYGAHATYAAKLALIGDLKWAYASCVVLGRCIVVVNMLPTMYKNGIMKLGSGNLRANPFVYKSVGDGAGGHHVVFDDAGVVGKYNRANRSLHHMVENMGVLCAGLYMAAQVFPFPVFVTTCLFAAGRVMHSIGYTKGYGVHALGFLTSTTATATLEGLLAFVALNA